MKKIVLLITLLIISLGWARAAEAPKDRQVTVQGRGRLSAPPDQARLRVEVTEDGPRVDAVSQDVR